MELDIATPNVHMTSSSSTGRRTPETGRTIKDTMVVVVPNLMSGRPTKKQTPILLIPAKPLDIIDVRTINVEMETTVKMVSVTRMDVI